MQGTAASFPDISELYSEDGSGSDSEGTEYTYSYHVPQIKDDTPGAASINEEISSLYGEIAQAGLKSVKNRELPDCHLVTFESYRHGNVISLVIKCVSFYEYYEEFNVYNYDTAKGVRLTNADILAMKEVTQEQYLYAVRRAAAKRYDDQSFPIWEDLNFVSNDSPWVYQERRLWTLSSNNITPDLPLYLDHDGAIHTVAAIGCHAGPNWLYQTLTLDLEDDAADVETNQSLDYLTVTRRGRAITLRFNKMPGSAAVLETDRYMDDVPYGKEIPVDGLYGDYTKIFCATAGELGTPYVFLLTREGRVDYVDVMMCLRYGYFCASGPLLGAADVKDFSTDTDENGLPRVYAITSSGEKIELHDLTVVDQHSMGGCFTGTWTHSRAIAMDREGPREGYVLLELTDDGDFNLTSYRSHQDENLEGHGCLFYLGMTEYGAVYAYRLWGNYSNGPGLTGVIALDREYHYSEDDSTITLNVRELGGTPFLGERTGETTVLTQSVG